MQHNNLLNLRNNFASLEYWRTNPDRLPQRFYIAFCLLMSSVQDYILGLKERESNNLNWSATCSYYSLVHGGRLICFLGLGDYPMSHDVLGKFLSGQQQSQRLNPYPFNWLCEFARQPNSSGNQAESTPDLLKMIESYLTDLNVVNACQRLKTFGEALHPACKLRNDSNYEALLIAHEYHHQTVSSAFDKLSATMSNVADSMLPFLIDSFNGFRRHDPDYSEKRDQYERFLHVYVMDRIGNAIRKKIEGCQTLEAKLENTLRYIGTSPTSAGYEDIERQVSMSLFEGKSQLMNGFLNRINNLANATPVSA
ncbi:MAG: hypothetical protein AB7P14_19035 [Blastocatellales bacterium]